MSFKLTTCSSICKKKISQHKNEEGTIDEISQVETDIDNKSTPRLKFILEIKNSSQDHSGTQLFTHTHTRKILYAQPHLLCTDKIYPVIGALQSLTIADAMH